MGLCLVLLLCRTTAAEPEGDKKAARKHLTAGDRHLARGDRLMDRGKMSRGLKAYRQALRSYQKAYETYPDAKIFFPIALAEQKLGHFLDALKHYQQMLDESAGTLPKAVSDRVEASITEVKKELVALDFQIAPEGALVRVDDSEVGQAPLAEEFWTIPGKHTYSVSLEGYEVSEGEVDLEAGAVEAIEIELPPLEQDLAETEEEGPEPPVQVADKSLTPLYIALGAAAVLGAGATYTGLQAVEEHRAFSDENRPPDERSRAQERGDSMALYTDLLLVGTVVAASYSAYYYLFYLPGARAKARERGKASASTSHMWVMPYVSEGGAGLAAGMGF